MKAKRQRIVAGNWKMNKDYEQGRELAMKVVDKLQPSDVKVVLCTPYIHIKSIGVMTKDINNLSVGAQNCHHEDGGAYTGEISSSMLKSLGTEYVILGHSERREYFQEDDALIATKLGKVLEQGMLPIYCCGEKLEIREAGTHVDLVSKQLAESVFTLSEEDFQQVVIAYEPVWAIGTGKTASPEQAQEMHAAIRGLIAKHYNEEVAEATTILYGGSVKPGNAKELFA
ncbi:MAG: triose-phosphate isomerase, partial [Bacteroidota bacterium]